jgi:hypothetical protein
MDTVKGGNSGHGRQQPGGAQAGERPASPGGTRGEGLSLIEAAERLEIAKSSLNRIEIGQTLLTVHLARSMMDLYHWHPDDLVERVRHARRSGWWKAHGVPDLWFIAFEAGVAKLSAYHPALVPGLLQTAGYARALFAAGRRQRTDGWLDNQVAIRLRRQDRLTDDPPVTLTAVISEHALLRPVGGVEVMRAQLRHLALVVELPAVTLRVLPAATVAAEAMTGAFTIFDFATTSLPSFVHLEHVCGHDRKDKPREVHAARSALDHLCALALDPDRSIAFIEQLADDL